MSFVRILKADHPFFPFKPRHSHLQQCVLSSAKAQMTSECVFYL